MGEFQKRINREFAKVKLTWQQKKNQEGEDWTIKGVEMDGKILVDSATKIVGEAKKEFPNSESAEFWFENSDWKQEFDDKEFMNTVNKWFLKWFGKNGEEK